MQKKEGRRREDFRLDQFSSLLLHNVESVAVTRVPLQPMSKWLIPKQSVRQKLGHVDDERLLNEDDIVLRHSEAVVKADDGVPPGTYGAESLCILLEVFFRRERVR